MLMSTLTKMVHLLRGHLADVPLDEEVDVGDDDEGWSKARSGMIPYNYIVALELPVGVTPILHLVEGVTRKNSKQREINKGIKMGHKETHSLISPVNGSLGGIMDRWMGERMDGWMGDYLNMAMSRLMSRMLVTRR